MKLRHLFLFVFTAAAILAGCKKEEVDYGTPSLSVSPDVITFENSDAAEQELTLNATREWKIEELSEDVAKWLAVSPDAGGASLEEQKITISVLQNDGNDREATVTFTIGLSKKSVTVKQPGAQGAVPTGNGTLESPYTVAGALALIETLAADANSPEVYVKGIISSFKGDPASDVTQYGSISYYISDDGNDANTLCVFGGKYFNGVKFTSADQIKVGDKVVILGTLTNFKGNTPEVNQGNRIVSLNGETGGDLPEVPGLDVPENVIYYNNFDKTAAVKEGEYFPYLDSQTQVDIWKNERGSGISTVEYKFNSGQSTRNTLPSNENTKYAGSGVNSIFFGANGGYLEIDNISVSGQNFVLSFGVSHGNSVVSKNEFHVYISADGENWVEISYDFPNELESKTWDLASYSFSVSSGISSLCFKFLADVKSVYRLDDVMLVPSETQGELIAFPNGGDEPETPEFSVSTTELKVAASETSATFNITGNVDWTVESETAGFTVAPESGNGEGTVTVSFDANESEEAKTATIRVSTEADVATKEYEVVITQSAPAVSGETILYYEDFGTPSSNTAVASYDGWTSSLITPTSDKWKVGTAEASDYDGASGNGNLFGATANSECLFNFGDKLSQYKSVKLSFGYRKGAGNGKSNTIKCYLSKDGGDTWSEDIIPENTGVGGWYAVSYDVDDTYMANFQIKFENTGANTNRVDDLKLVGVPVE